MRERLRLRLQIIRPPLLRLAVLGLLGSAIAAIWGVTPALCLGSAALAALLLFHVYYIGALGAWLERPAPDEIPAGIGAWERVFTSLYRARRASERDRQQLIENEQRYRRTISALPEGIVLVDSVLQIEWCNPVAERHLGIELRADEGLRLTNLVRDPPFVAYMTSGSFGEPLTFRPMAQPALALSLQVIRFEPRRSIVITRDVTQSERVDAMRRDFVANVSHEMRTPLTVVTGFVETLLDAQPPLGELQRHHLALMQEQALRMMRLIEDLLLLSGLESEQRPRVEEVIDAAALVREMGDEARALSKGRHQVLVDAAAGRLRGSGDELRSAFGNLVSNAVRYTPAGGWIAIRWRQRGAGAAFEVEDSGIGVAPEHLSRLTERFYRVDKSRSRDTGGTGLGLAIAKHVLLRHQGGLEVRSQPGVGSTFSAWLPASRIVGEQPGGSGQDDRQPAQEREEA